MALPLFATLFVVVASGNDSFGLLRTRGALVLRECSYSIYLTHGILLAVTYQDLAPTLQAYQTETLAIMVVPIVGLLVVALSALLYLVIERPSHRVGIRIAGYMKRLA